jgi:hypothetical protein
VDIRSATLGDILRLHARIGAELKLRGISRTGNNPCADFAEMLFCRTFGWKQNPNSNAGYDAVDELRGLRIEIKARRLSRPGGSRQVSALRRLDAQPFDRLAGILFDADYEVLLAVEVPYAVVASSARHNEHTNSGRFFLRESLLAQPGVLDLTERMQEAARAMLSAA